MSYLDISFLIFLFLSLFVYYVVPKKLRKLVILISSLVFYLSAGIIKIVFVGVAFLITYFTTKKIHSIYLIEKRTAPRTVREEVKSLNLQKKYLKKRAAKVARVGAVSIIAILVLFKIINVNTSGSGFFSEYRNFYDILVPVGLSYYTFSSVGYILDVYWRKADFEPNALTLLTCMTYFPHIVEGPIGRYRELLPQFDSLPGFQMKPACFGMQRMVWGYFKKLVIADRIAVVTAAIFGSPEAYGGLYVFIGMLLNVIQVYTDFSGCMDIVIGISEAYGVRLAENFDHPFFSLSIAEFWRRWHITLCKWFRDYVYMPLSVSKKHMQAVIRIRKRSGASASRAYATIVPMLVVWILTGLWHGTGWNYILWGVYYGILMSCGILLQKQFKRAKSALRINDHSKGWKLFCAIRTFLLFGIGRMITVYDRWDSLWIVIKDMFSAWNPWIFCDDSFYNLGLNRKNFNLMLLSIVLLYLVEFWQTRQSIREFWARRNIAVRWIAYLGAICLVVILGMYGPGYNASNFVYANY